MGTAHRENCTSGGLVCVGVGRLGQVRGGSPPIRSSVSGRLPGSVWLCQVLDVNRSNCCQWLASVEARVTRQREDRILAEGIRGAVSCGVLARTAIRSPSSTTLSMTSGNRPENTIWTSSLTFFTRMPTTRHDTPSPPKVRQGR